MNRQEFDELVQAEIDGVISPEDESRLQQALAEDPELADGYAESRALMRMFDGLRAARSQPPKGLTDRVLAGVRERGRSTAAAGDTTTRFAGTRFLVPLGLAALLLIAVGGAFWAGRQTTLAENDDFEAEISSKFYETIRRDDLSPEAAQPLLDQFRRELRRIEQDDRRAVREAAIKLEDGLRKLASESR